MTDKSKIKLATLGWEDCEGVDLKLETTCSAFPFQIEGKLNNVHLYYRARYSTWTLSISSESLNAAVEGQVFASGKFFSYDPAVHVVRLLGILQQLYMTDLDKVFPRGW